MDTVPLTEWGGGVPRAWGSVPVAGDGPLEIEQREHVTAAAVEPWMRSIPMKNSSSDGSSVASTLLVTLYVVVFLCTPMKIDVRRLKRKRSYLWDD